MPYDPVLVQPMREELSSIGVKELTSADEVEAWMNEKQGTALLVINSVCGCAAGGARPAVRLALEQGEKKPERVGTVFAGQDIEATQRARQHFPEIPPSSPSMYLFKDGELVYVLPRHGIEGFSAEAIAQELQEQFAKYC